MMETLIKQNLCLAMSSPSISSNTVKLAVEAMREGLIDSFAVSLDSYRVIDGKIQEFNQYFCTVCPNFDADKFSIVGKFVEDNGEKKDITVEVDGLYSLDKILYTSDYKNDLEDFIASLDYELDATVANWYDNISDFDTAYSSDFFEKNVHFFPAQNF